MQADSRVGRRRAFQILAGEDESPRSKPQSYHTHFTCKVGPEKNIQPMGNRKESHPRSNEVKCYRCGEDHQTYSRNCPVFKNEMEIVRIQTKERIPWQQVIRKLLRLDPHPELIYSHAVENTSNRTTSKSSNRKDQESQSESSEDDSPTVPSYGHRYYAQGKVPTKKSKLCLRTHKLFPLWGENRFL